MYLQIKMFYVVQFSKNYDLAPLSNRVSGVVTGPPDHRNNFPAYYCMDLTTQNEGLGKNKSLYSAAIAFVRSRCSMWVWLKSRKSLRQSPPVAQLRFGGLDEKFNLGPKN